MSAQQLPLATASGLLGEEDGGVPPVCHLLSGPGLSWAAFPSSPLCGLLPMSLEPQGTYTEVPNKCMFPHFYPLLVKAWSLGFLPGPPCPQGTSQAGPQWAFLPQCALVLSPANVPNLCTALTRILHCTLEALNFICPIAFGQMRMCLGG